MRKSIVGEKSFKFAVEIVKIYKQLCDSQNEYSLSKQLLRSGTSIGANIREALEAQSKKDFVSKLSIALKEAVETEYWLELLAETDYLPKKQAEELMFSLEEIVKLLNSIIKTTKKNAGLVL